MKLYIEGYRSQNRYIVETLTDAAYFYVYKLLGGHMFPNIILDIKLTKGLYEKEKAYGYCQISGDAKKPREFEIELDSSKENTITNLLIWLAHECVHLKQFVRDELSDFEDGSVKWKSKVIKRSLNSTKSPWEKEAYRLEVKLYKQFAECYNE